MNAPLLLPTLLCLSTCLVEVCLGMVSEERPMKLLRDRLLKNYSTRIRPVHNQENTTVVTFELTPVHIVSMDEKQGILYLDTVADMSWEDQSLHWDPQEYSGIERLQLSSTQIWKPDVRVFTSRSFRTAPWGYVDLSVDSKGRVSWSPPAPMSLICEPFDYTSYPRDVQSCYVELGCWVENSNEISYVLKERDSPSQKFARTATAYWSVQSFNGSVVTFVDLNDEPQVTMMYQLFLKRVKVPHTYLGSVPEAVARVLILCVFWLPGLTKKLCLGCLTLVLLTTIIIHVIQLLPSPAASPFALAEPMAALEMCMAAIILEIVVSFLPVLDVATPVILDRMSRVKALQILATGTSKPLIEEDQEEAPAESPKPKTDLNHWAFLGTLVDRIAFVVFAVLLLAV